MRKDKAYKSRRQIYRSLLLFPVPPLIGGLLQMQTPEVSVVWASTVISMLIIFINLQNTEITTDSLTGLFNRRQIAPYLDGRIHKRESQRDLYVILMDLDGFKQINDRFGHTVGDRALQQAADILQQSHAQADFLARYGGDEFLMVAEREKLSDVTALITHIRQNCVLYNQRSAEPYELSVSAGYARWEDGYSSIDTFIAAADARMYEDKGNRKNAGGKIP